MMVKESFHAFELPHVAMWCHLSISEASRSLYNVLDVPSHNVMTSSLGYVLSYITKGIVVGMSAADQWSWIIRGPSTIIINFVDPQKICSEIFKLHCMKQVIFRSVMLLLLCPIRLWFPQSLLSKRLCNQLFQVFLVKYAYGLGLGLSISRTNKVCLSYSMSLSFEYNVVFYRNLAK